MASNEGPQVSQTALEMIDITKTFPGVVALDRVALTCLPGEVHALVGENGAGKSTLMKILAGVYRPDSGRIKLNSREVGLASPSQARDLGIAIIYQDFNLLPWLSATENILLGHLPRTGLGLIDWTEAGRRAQAVQERLGICLDLREKVIDFSVAEQQLVEIAKALSWPKDPSLLIMDEPSAVLAGHELDQLFKIIRTLRGQGVTVIYISHRLDEVFQIADRVTVLRDGRVAGSGEVAGLDKPRLISLMVGRSLDETFPPSSGRPGRVVLEVKGLSSLDLGLSGVGLTVREGEILGLAGLVGAGRTALAKVLFGLAPADEGEMLFQGRPLEARNPRRAIQSGLALVPENRKEQGLILSQSLRSNGSLVILERLKKWLFIDSRRELQVIRRQVEEMDIKTPSLDQEVGYLSGGNQQKVVLAKWLSTSPKLIIMDEPTRGIDVGAKAEIYRLMRRLADQGTAIIMISSELQEIIGMSDRVLVMARGRVAGELAGPEATEERIMTLAVGETLPGVC